MILFPAIDLLDGRCVRLRRGDFGTAHQVAADPLETARRFQKAGAAWIHLVDLDGARTGSAQNREIIFRIARETSLQVETGGGIRDMDTIAFYLQNGVSRVILGSAALENPQLVQKAVEKYGDRIAVGIDAKDGMVSAQGWLSDTNVNYLALAQKMAAGRRQLDNLYRYLQRRHDERTCPYASCAPAKTRFLRPCGQRRDPLAGEFEGIGQPFSGGGYFGKSFVHRGD